MRVLVTLLVLAAAPALATVYTVAPTGGDFTSIQAALDLAVAGDTVQVRQAPAPYFEKLVFPRSGTSGNPITLEAYPGEHPIVDGTGVPGDDLVLIDTRSYIRVIGLELRNNLNVNDGSGIRVIGAGSHIELRQNRIHDIRDTNAMGITVFGTEPAPISNLVIDGNEIWDCEPAPSEALTLNGNVTDFEVTNNVVRDVDNIGIDAIGGETDIQPDPTKVARNGVFRGNTVIRARSSYGGGFAGGIYIDGGRDIVIENNVVTESDLGIEVGAENNGITARNIVVRNNVVFRNDKVCIVFGGFAQGVGRVRDSEFSGNTCWQNDTLGAGFGELWIQYAEDNVVRNNVFVATTQGLLLLSEGGNVGNLLDYNLWHTTAGAPRFVWNGDEHVGLAAYAAATGQDAHSLFADPVLPDAASGDFHLGAGSPAVDAGDPAFSPAVGELDLDGAPRVNGPRVDMGVDEATSCGDGVPEAPEECDDGDLDSGDGCDANCTVTACGNGIVTAGEQCDDGGTAGGDCCSPTCQLEPLGTSCDDGNPCTSSDGCTAGTCAGLPEPAAGCRAAASTQLKLVDGSPDTKDQIVWKWSRGAATTTPELGDPVAGGTGYTLCVYDTTAGSSSIALRADVPAAGTCRGKPCWKRTGATGFRYGDRDLSPAGILSMKLKSGLAGRATIALKGKGELLDMPDLPLDQGPTVTVQLRRSDGPVCWETTHTAPAKRNDDGQFKDVAD